MSALMGPIATAYAEMEREQRIRQFVRWFNYWTHGWCEYGAANDEFCGGPEAA